MPEDKRIPICPEDSLYLIPSEKCDSARFARLFAELWGADTRWLFPYLDRDLLMHWDMGRDRPGWEQIPFITLSDTWDEHSQPCSLVAHRSAAVAVKSYGVELHFRADVLDRMPKHIVLDLILYALLRIRARVEVTKFGIEYDDSKSMVTDPLMDLVLTARQDLVVREFFRIAPYHDWRHLIDEWYEDNQGIFVADDAVRIVPDYTEGTYERLQSKLSLLKLSLEYLSEGRRSKPHTPTQCLHYFVKLMRFISRASLKIDDELSHEALAVCCGLESAIYPVISQAADLSSIIDEQPTTHDRMCKWEQGIQKALSGAGHIWHADLTKLVVRMKGKLIREHHQKTEPPSLLPASSVKLNPSLLGKVQEHIEWYRENHNGSDPVPDNVTTKVPGNRQMILACLRELRKNGKYSGHKRKPRG